MKNYAWLPLKEVLKYEPEMERLGVSKVARSSRGFLTAYKGWGIHSVGMDLEWGTARGAFIARHLAQYRKKPTYRRWLALVAWAYMPDKRYAK